MIKALPFAAVIVISFLGLGAGGQSESGSSPGDLRLEQAVVQAEHIKLSAEEPGILIDLAVKAGDPVRAKQPIGKIDDREIQIQMKAAGYAYSAAKKKFEDDVDIKYSAAAAAVAKTDYEIIEAAIDLVEKSITDVDRRRAKLEWEKMDLATEKAKKEQELARLDALGKLAELEAARLAIERRTITAPWDGVVEELTRKQHEWVNPGDPILRLFRMDKMYVEAAVDQKQYDPQELKGRDVTVEVKMARGRIEKFEGQIVKVSPVIRYDGVYNVRAEVLNRPENGDWMLRDGLPATMTIHLTSPAAVTKSARLPK
jgi:multidrug resistance efflux pump